jgi:hypothetical protein
MAKKRSGGAKRTSNGRVTPKGVRPPGTKTKHDNDAGDDHPSGGSRHNPITAPIPKSGRQFSGAPTSARSARRGQR